MLYYSIILPMVLLISFFAFSFQFIKFSFHIRLAYLICACTLAYHTIILKLWFALIVFSVLIILSPCLILFIRWFACILNYPSFYIITPKDLYTGVIPYPLYFGFNSDSILEGVILLPWNIIFDLFILMDIILSLAQFSQVVMVSSSFCSVDPTIFVSSA